MAPAGGIRAHALFENQLTLKNNCSFFQEIPDKGKEVTAEQ